MKAKELREKSTTELNEELTKSLREQVKYRISKVNGDFAQNHKMKAIRRYIALINTIIREKRG